MRFLKFLLGVLLVAVLLVGAWFFRPWAEYSPAKIVSNNSKSPAKRAEVYRKMDEVFPYHKIEGAGQVIGFRESLKPLGDISYQIEGETYQLTNYIHDHYLTGLIVLRGDTLLHESYYRGETAEDRHTSWSVAKSYVATLIGIAEMEGLIESLDDPVEKYSAIYKDTDYGKISLRHLLMMSSGVDFIEDYETDGSDMRKLFFDVFLHHKDPDKMIRQYDQTIEPGKIFNYISPNSHVLSAVIRDVYGEPFAKVIEKKLYKPLGMADAYWSKSADNEKGKDIGYCCLNTRARDYARFGQLYLKDGIWEGKRLLPEGWVDFVRTPPTPSHEPYGERQDGPIREGHAMLGYGHHFWVPPTGNGAFYAGGYNGQTIWVDQSRDIVIVQTAADNWFDQNMAHKIGAMEAIAAHFGDVVQ